jgi:hypothetical protein
LIFSIKPQPQHRNTSVRGWNAFRSIRRSIIGCRHWAQRGASTRRLRRYEDASAYIEGARSDFVGCYVAGRSAPPARMMAAGIAQCGMTGMAVLLGMAFVARCEPRSPANLDRLYAGRDFHISERWR